MLLYVAGHETTVNLIGNGTLALLRDRDAARAAAGRSGARREPSRRAVALRRPGADEPARDARSRTRSATASIEPGTILMTCLGSANRDPAAWGDSADRLDLRRADSQPARRVRRRLPLVPRRAPRPARSPGRDRHPRAPLPAASSSRPTSPSGTAASCSAASPVSRCRCRCSACGTGAERRPGRTPEVARAIEGRSSKPQYQRLRHRRRAEARSITRSRTGDRGPQPVAEQSWPAGAVGPAAFFGREPSARRERAAVGVHGRAGHERGEVRREEQRDARGVVGGSEPADAGTQLGIRCSSSGVDPSRVRHLQRLGHVGRDRVDADAGRVRTRPPGCA